MLSFFLLATSLLSERMVSFDPLCGIAARRKEGNHETCRAAPARYMDVADFKKQTQLFGSVFLCASIVNGKPSVRKR